MGYRTQEQRHEADLRGLVAFSPLLQRLLVNRGIATAADADAFLNPDYTRDIHDPFLLLGMREAVDRIMLAIAQGEHIALFSDFDADGIPAAVVMHDTFKKLGYKNFSVTIPHRNTEGFGLNADAVTKFIADNVSVVLTLDCGMGDAVHVKRLSDVGIDVIVTDHHLPNHDIPEAFAIVNPNQAGDTYPNKNLCGAGVAYKIAQALFKKNIESGILNAGEENSERNSKSQIPTSTPVGWEKWLLDVVAIATLSDMVMLTGENRALAHYGLMVLRKSRRVGLQTLLSHLRIKQRDLTEDDVVFMITPRINAASRMDEPELAFRLLATEDDAEAETLVRHLDEINNERKGVVAHMTKEIKEKLGEETTSSVVVVGNPHWKPGLLGLAATKVVELYGKPAFVWGRGDAAVIKGSCRSDGSVDVNVLMHETREYFLEYGGHARSGGFSTTVEHVVALEGVLHTAYEKIKTDVTKADYVLCDAELAPSEVTETTWRDIKQLAPFGMGNPKPIFAFPNVTIAKISWFGKNKEHIRLTIAGENGRSAEAIHFFAKDTPTFAGLNAGDTGTVLGTMEESSFGRTKEIRLRIVDVIK